jgi:heme-degrading monooxygenase HmoA
MTKMEAGFVYIWEYDVREGCELDFEALYGPKGSWARLFQKCPQYLGTELLRDRSTERHYVTIDRWATEDSHREFVSVHREEFEELDGKGERLTSREASIGDFDAVKSGA